MAETVRLRLGFGLVTLAMTLLALVTSLRRKKTIFLNTFLPLTFSCHFYPIFQARHGLVDLVVFDDVVVVPAVCTSEAVVEPLGSLFIQLTAAMLCTRDCVMVNELTCPVTLPSSSSVDRSAYNSLASAYEVDTRVSQFKAVS